MRSYRLEVYDQGTGRYFWQSDADVVWDYIECQKAKFNENCVKIGQSRLYIQAVPLASEDPTS